LTIFASSSASSGMVTSIFTGRSGSPSQSSSAASIAASRPGWSASEMVFPPRRMRVPLVEWRSRAT
jgi:hypothetical protein